MRQRSSGGSQRHWKEYSSFLVRGDSDTGQRKYYIRVHSNNLYYVKVELVAPKKAFDADGVADSIVGAASDLASVDLEYFEAIQVLRQGVDEIYAGAPRKGSGRRRR